MSDVIAVVPDLFFAARIEGTAKALGVDLQTLTSDAALAACRDQPPGLVVVDLTAKDDPIALVRAIKELRPTRPIRVVGFYPHVERALREGALAAGADEVLPRSAFTAQLATLLGGEGRTTP